MRKIKLFYSSDYTVSYTEGDVNEFIKDKDIIAIKITSEGTEIGHSFMIMVIYEEVLK